LGTWCIVLAGLLAELLAIVFAEIICVILAGLPAVEVAE